jgi:tryptophanyl-tRNA synthetase
VEKEYAQAAVYSDFKSNVGEAVASLLSPVRERYAEIRPDARTLDEVLAAGAAKARAISSVVVSEARERMGLGPPA